MINRRRFIVGASGIAIPALNLRAQDSFLGGDASAQATSFWERPRWVWLRRPATGEQIKLVYWRDGQLIPEAYDQASWFLRDVRFQRMLAAGDPHIRSALEKGLIAQQHLSPWIRVEPVLLDILYAYCAWLQLFGLNTPLNVNSGFRHLITNFLTEGAAKDSEHMKGGAADIVVPGVPAANLARFGRWLSGGGVGLYQSRGFIHIDRGRVRTWTGS